jgi:hypothetical protein
MTWRRSDIIKSREDTILPGRAMCDQKRDVVAGMTAKPFYPGNAKAGRARIFYRTTHLKRFADWRITTKLKGVHRWEPPEGTCRSIFAVNPEVPAARSSMNKRL